MNPLVLKKSCDSCTRSKVKCSGGYPCERCSGKAMECFYSPRKSRTKGGSHKRMKKEKVSEPHNDKLRPKRECENGVIISKTSFGSDEYFGSLVDWERRSWSVFFTLYKHYGTSCSLHWFNAQLLKMRSYLRRQGNQDSLRRLTSWMHALNVDVDGLAEQVENVRIKCMTLKAGLPLDIKGIVNDSKPQESPLKPESDRIPFIKLRTLFGADFNEEDVEVECNDAFEKILGISSKAIVEQLKWTGGGFLPWGSDVLARMVSKEQDLLAFVQILAIKFNSMGPPQKLPTVRDIPSCHVFELNVKKSADSIEKIPSAAFIKCLHREIITQEKCIIEMSLQIDVLAPHDHLLTPPTTLTLPAKVSPFPVLGQPMKRSHSFDLESEIYESETQEMLSGSGHYMDYNINYGQRRSNTASVAGSHPGVRTPGSQASDPTVTASYKSSESIVLTREMMNPPKQTTGSSGLHDDGIVGKSERDRRNVGAILGFNAPLNSFDSSARDTFVSANPIEASMMEKAKAAPKSFGYDAGPAPSLNIMEEFYPPSAAPSGRLTSLSQNEGKWLDGLLDWANDQELLTGILS